MNIKKSERGIYEPVMSEEDVLCQVRQMLEINGARVFRVIERIPWGRTKSEGGIPDLFGWWPKAHSFVPGVMRCEATHYFIEIKRKGGPRRPAQVEWIRRANEDGVLACFAESWKDVVDYFEREGIKLKIT